MSYRMAFLAIGIVVFIVLFSYVSSRPYQSEVNQIHDLKIQADHIQQQLNDYQRTLDRIKTAEFNRNAEELEAAIAELNRQTQAIQSELAKKD